MNLSDSITVRLIDGCARDWWTWRLYLRCLMGAALRYCVLWLFQSLVYVAWWWLDTMHLFVRYTYIFKRSQLGPRAASWISCQYTRDSSFYSQQGPLDVLREQTLATPHYLSQHRLSSILADQGHMPETVKHDYRFCQYHNPALAHDDEPCDCLTKTNDSKWTI
jgi:hypothetical protein